MSVKSRAISKIFLRRGDSNGVWGHHTESFHGVCDAVELQLQVPILHFPIHQVPILRVPILRVPILQVPIYCYLLFWTR